MSVVSYANSYPFIYGLQHHPVSRMIELQTDIPSDCAQKLLSGEVDLGLVPVAIIPKLSESHIVSSSCIGADGPVETVCLFSEVPLSEIDTVLLDYQSRTSVQLVQYLAANRWKIDPEWKPASTGFISEIKGRTAGVVIGDRAFALTSSYPVVYDLAAEWKEQTGLPFVFACWVSNRQLPSDFVSAFDEALLYGLQHRAEAVAKMASADHLELLRYVTDVIRYDLDEKKRQGMKLFLDWLSKSA